ncbi:MAG TPA: right-handed parallel beta-helix repeat-containing protein [Dehalococcoidia bacterium]|nr:right-handed parallel beta-helix repeat-containing protein [Dehalococcoidia bacterium]
MKIKTIYLASALVLVFSLAAALIPAGPVMAQPPYYVSTTGSDTTGDGSAGNPWGNISYAVGQAASGTTIHVAAGQYNEHDITINKSLTIQGAGEGGTIVDGNALSRVFHINGSYTVDMSGITIRNGNMSGYGGGLYNNNGKVTITNCTVSENDADDSGGIFNLSGNMTITNCTISGNNALNWGGGIFNASGNMTITNCTISGNSAATWGGGILNSSGNMTITNCTVSGNKVDDDGGGIYNTSSGNVTLTNCTVSGNTASGDGGGIWNETGDVTLTNCTISGNTADSGGGVISYVSINITCTIVYGNTVVNDGSNIYGPYTDIGSESIVGSPDPLLGPLQNNGGPTETHALMIGSPAIDACVTSCTVNTDQRGLPRPVDGDLDGTYFCDVGAYEKQPAVGGIIEPVDRLELLAPWLALAALMAVALSVVVVMRRRRLA